MLPLLLVQLVRQPIILEGELDVLVVDFDGGITELIVLVLHRTPATRIIIVIHGMEAGAFLADGRVEPVLGDGLEVLETLGPVIKELSVAQEVTLAEQFPHGETGLRQGVERMSGKSIGDFKNDLWWENLKDRTVNLGRVAHPHEQWLWQLGLALAAEDFDDACPHLLEALHCRSGGQVSWVFFDDILGVFGKRGNEEENTFKLQRNKNDQRRSLSEENLMGEDNNNKIQYIYGN
jgi:hypothetical protein